MEKVKGTQHDLGELFNAQRGLESDKITERKVRVPLRASILEKYFGAH